MEKIAKPEQGARSNPISWQARYAHFPFRYLLTLDGYVVWIVVARSALRPLSNNVQLGKIFKGEGKFTACRPGYPQKA